MIAMATPNTIQARRDRAKAKLLQAARDIDASGGLVSVNATIKAAGMSLNSTTFRYVEEMRESGEWPWPALRPGHPRSNVIPLTSERRVTPMVAPVIVDPPKRSHERAADLPRNCMSMDQLGKMMGMDVPVSPVRHDGAPAREQEIERAARSVAEDINHLRPNERRIVLSVALALEPALT